ncbi:EAL domain-containing protein [Methylomarinum sp. Ch1-1]|uniref:EAL domain-containing protein n=1 Tax=Methylomarinum roseum TaxID=3067653 RepID=A0AAU7NYZ7_9GAMM|nr:EAL domain-containing protein [Methylomarinum sp. Ch1-1]MDP4521711.1 EAL domain-containing protein [Methylomarinum sp. Ch1-1]
MGDFNILYLDNNLFLSQQVKMRLEWRGYRVEISDSERECLTKLRGQQVDLLLLDYGTPESDGLKFLDQLKRLELMPATIIVNPQQDFQLATQAMSRGCLDYVLKDTLIQRYVDRLNLSIFQIHEQRRLSKAQLRKSTTNNSQSHTIDWEYYPDRDIVYWQPHDNEKTTFSYEEFISKVLKDDLATVKTQNNICLFSQQAVEYPFHYLTAPDRLCRYQAKIQAETDEQGGVKRLHGRLLPLATQPYFDETSRLKLSYLDNTSDAIFISDARKRIIKVNDHFSKITGYAKPDIINRPVSILNPEHYDAEFFQPIAATLKHNHFWQGEIVIRHRQGHSVPVWQSISVLKDDDGNISRSISVLKDISQQKAYEESIQFQANYDPLTQLPNRTLFLDRLANALKQSKRNQSKLALMLVDLDKFKWINDNLGHHAGDILLQETAKKLQCAVRNSDTVARLGGDEFSVIIPDLDKATDTEVIANKIFTAFRQPISIDQQEVFITGSVGITLYPDDGEDIETLQKNADCAMYMAKNKGRNNYYYYTPSLQKETEQRLQLTHDLRQAMQNQEFSLHFQPIMDMKTERVACAETLLRWKRPKSGYIPLQSFIPIAEESGLIRDIGNWVIGEVADNIQRWNHLGIAPIQLSLNQSVAQYNRSECYVEWLDIIKQKQISPRTLAFEINEGLFIDDKSNYSASVKKLQQAGIQISLDRFGTGYSSLSYLKKYPVDVIKIDRSYIHSMLEDSSDAIMVETIISLANKLGIKVIATGVENRRQLALLNRQCRYAQGYLFSKPLPINEFEDFLKVKNR